MHYAVFEIRSKKNVSPVEHSLKSPEIYKLLKFPINFKLKISSLQVVGNKPQDFTSDPIYTTHKHQMYSLSQDSK